MKVSRRDEWCAGVVNASGKQGKPDKGNPICSPYGREAGMQPMHVRDLMTQDHESTGPMVTSMGLRELLGPSVTTP